MTDQEVLEPDRVTGAPHPRHTLELIGQSVAENAFLEAFNTGRLHHAWLITGPKGVGKATLSWKIARFLLSQPVDAPTGLLGSEPSVTSLSTAATHPIMARTNALSEPRLMLVRRPWDHKTGKLRQSITVDEVRKVKEFFALSAADGGRRIVLIDAADEMNNAAANALLKILEEPPKDTTLLLVSHQPSRLLPTIRSRCRVLGCAALDARDLKLALAAAGLTDTKGLETIESLAGGSVGEAIHLLSENGSELYENLLRLMDDAPKMNRTAMLDLANSCVGKTAEARYDLTLRLISTMLGRLAKSGVSKATRLTLSPSEIQAMSKKCNTADQARLWANLAQVLSARAAHGRSVNLDPATVILDMLLKLNLTAETLRPV